MEKLNRSQLPDSSSSPPLGGIFHNFDDDAMSDLPSCVYANVHHHHHQLNPAQISINSLGMTHSGNQSPSANNSLRVNANNFKLHQHFLHHSGEISDTPATSTSSPSLATFGGPIKNNRQHGVVRERKRTMRSAPNGYLNEIIFPTNKISNRFSIP